MKKYDVGIMGVWYGCNYGSIATYYALNNVITSMGKSVLMIDKPLINPNDVELGDTHSRRFARENYNISKNYELNELKELNNDCDTFLLGSDQLWNYGISKNFGKSYYLDFVNSSNKKLAYAVSFGHDVDFAPDSEKGQIAELMGRFDGISVREKDGVSICKNEYGVKATQVVDPVFLADPSIYDELISKSKHLEDEPYLCTYILDPTPEKREAILYASKKLGNIKIINLLDGTPWSFEKNQKLMDLENCIENVEIYEWLYYLKNASFVITDSCHGASFALIFKKNLIPIANAMRGFSRFFSLTELFGISDRLVTDPKDILTNDKLFADIDYKKIDKIISKERKRCYSWLKELLLQPKKSPEQVKKDTVIGPATISPLLPKIKELHSNKDFINIRILATLFRDYGIKHIVLSPGGRDVPIIRMFEKNEDSFVLHRVTDERSAAYYALGLASRLKSAVACVCTSGTAASNYLPAVTEAYYTGIPLVVVTADRYEVYHGQGEDQTITQKNIFGDNVKMSVSLPESGIFVEHQSRRDISACILEATHNGFGPVHINIPVQNISIGADLPKEHWALLPRINPHILRVSFNNGETDMMRWVDALKSSPRILLVCGQNPMLTEEEKNDIESFASKYNCAILTDSISNFSSNYCVNSFNLLNEISQEEFDNTLAPDILITVGGKRLMNDPLTFKVRHGKNIRHWSVTPDGKIKDFYFKLSSVIETTQAQFFKWFSAKAGNIKNNRKYLELWKNAAAKHPSKKYVDFNALYIQQSFFPNVPPSSFLHLGVGQSFFDVRKQSIDPSVEVYCNMGTNGIDGCTSTFMGQCAVEKQRLCFLIVGDLSFFYDMNSIWNKPLNKNIRILLVNNNGSGLLRGHGLKAVSSVHNTIAKGWVESTGFEYLSARNKDEFESNLKYFLSNEPQKAVFFEVLCN